MAYIDWWNRTGPVTLGERFGLNEISIARNTLSPTKSYTEDRIDMKPGGIVEPGVTNYGGPGSGPKTKGPDNPLYKVLNAEGKKIAMHVYGTLDISDRKRKRINSREITMDTKPVQWNPETDISVKSKHGQPVTSVDFRNLKLPDGTDMEKAFIEDLKLRAKQPQKAVIDYGNEWFAEKYPITERQLDKAIPYLIKKHKIKYLEIEETPAKRHIKKRKGYLEVSSSKLQEGRIMTAKTKILKEKNLVRKIDFGHRVSKRHMAALGLQFDTNLVGMDSKVINQVIIRPSEKKLDRLYTKQFKIFEQLKDNPTNELLKKQLADINTQVKAIIKATSGRLVGVTIDPNTLESSFEGLKKKYSLTQFMNENMTIKDLEKLSPAEQKNFLTKQLTKAVNAEVKKGFVPNDFKTILSDKKSQEAILKYAKKTTPELIGKLKWAFKNPNSKVSMKLLSKALGPIAWGSIYDDILKKRTEGKSLLEAVGSQIFLGGAQKDWQERKYTSKNLTPAHVQVQNRVKILELADKNRISVFDIATASERDSEYKGSPHKYIEWLKFKVREPDQQGLLQERREAIETGMVMPPEKIEEAKEQYKSWKSIPGVRAVEELFKSDEQKAKDLENLLKV